MVKKIIIYLNLYVITISIVLAALILHPINRENIVIFHYIIVVFMSLLVIKYSKAIFLIIIAPWNKVLAVMRDKKYSSNYYNPKVSIIIPAYNEEVGLLETVKTVLKSEYTNLEVVIVNDGSTDNSHKMMLDFIEMYKKKKSETKQMVVLDSIKSIKKKKSETKQVTFKYYYKQNGGKGKALNYGIRKSTGDIIITIDADCIITPTTVDQFVKPFRDYTIDAVVGNVKIGNRDTVVGMVQFLEFLSSFYAKNAESVLGTIYIIGGAAAAFRRSVFDVVGFYNHKNITEDIDISVRICDAGLKIVYAEDAIVYTEGASDVTGLAKQRLRWKIGWFQTLYANTHILFSIKPQHNKILSWIMIPFVYFSNVQLIFEPWFIIFLYCYSYWLMNFEPFLTWIGAEAVMISVVLFTDKQKYDKQKYKWTIFLFTPIAWILFYLSTYIEYRSLIFTIWHTIKKKEVKWQKWQRSGCGVRIE